MSFLQQAALVLLTAVAVNFLPSLLREQRLQVPEIYGFTAPGFEHIKDVFRQNFELGYDRRAGGTAFSVYHKGQKVVDIWAGHSDFEGKVKWKQDTLGLIYSTSKGVTSIAVGVLVDRGHLDVNKPVSHYWPEFAQHGKENITVATLLDHEAGLSSVSDELTYDLLADLDRLDNVLAASKPLWEPGTAHGYHAITFGFLVNAVFRRADPKGRTIGRFFAEEVSEPFGIDLHIGIPIELSHRVMRAVPIDAGIIDIATTVLNSAQFRNFFYGYLWHIRGGLLSEVVENCGEVCDFAYQTDPYIRNIEMPSVNGFATASALAKLWGILASGGVSMETNETLLSTRYLEHFETFNEPIVADIVLYNHPTQWRYGMGIKKDSKGGKNHYGHAGAGGQMGYADPNLELGYGFVTRYKSVYLGGDDPRFVRLKEAVVDAVEKMSVD